MKSQLKRYHLPITQAIWFVEFLNDLGVEATTSSYMECGTRLWFTAALDDVDLMAAYSLWTEEFNRKMYGKSNNR